MLKIGSNDFIFSFLSFPFFCALCDYYVNFINQIEKVEFLKWSVITFARLEIFIDKFLFTQLLDIANLNCWNLSNDFLFFFLLFLFSLLINFIKENFDCRNIKYYKFTHFDRRIKICWENWEIDFLNGSYIPYTKIYKLQVQCNTNANYFSRENNNNHS